MQSNIKNESHIKREVSTVDQLADDLRPGLKPGAKVRSVAIATTGSWQALKGNVRSSARLRQA